MAVIYMEKNFQFLMNPPIQDLKPLFVGASPNASDSTIPKALDCTVIYYVLSGCGSVYMDEQEFAVHAGQAFIILPGKTTSWRSSAHAPWSYQWLGFTGALSHRFAELAPVFDVPEGVITPLTGPKEMNTHIEYRLVSELFMLFYLLLEPKREQRSYVQQIVDLIQSSYMQKLTVEAMATQFRMDRSYLNRQFKKATGYSIKEYITKVRLDRAVWYLARGYSVKETAVLCGFSDVSNFSKAFKQHHPDNLSPQQWRLHITKVHKEQSLLTSPGKITV